MNRPDTITLGATSLELSFHTEDLLGEIEDSGFGSLLFDSDGRVCLHEGTRTWLYTTTKDPQGRWVSDVREFDIATLEVGQRTRILTPAADDAWAVVHHVIRVNKDLCVAFYSNGHGVRCAVSPGPAVPFTTDRGFRLDPSEPWELLNNSSSACSLEANGGYVKVSEDDDQLIFWEIYDSYHPGQIRGELGWAKVQIRKGEGSVGLIAKHPRNPLKFLPNAYLCARCGGNLASDVLLDGKRLFFFYTRANASTLSAFVAMSRDPLFFDFDQGRKFDLPRGREVVIEKFQHYQRSEFLHLIYECKLTDGSWRTGLRRYRLKSDNIRSS